jgi:uncharacterized membrane protein
MEGAIVLLILVVIVIFVVPIFIAWNTSSRVSDLIAEIKELKGIIKQMQKNSSEPIRSVEEVQSTSKPIVNQEKPIPPKPEPEKLKPIIPLPPKLENKTELIPEPKRSNESTEDAIIASPDEKANSTTKKPIAESIFSSTKTTPSIPNTSSAKKKTDFEQFIGEKLISLVGIGILVLGIFFTVKWAIGRNLITDAGKILIGLLAGTVLVGVAHRLSKNYRAFSSILAGGGIAVYYFSIYQAYQSYHLLPQSGAFAAMIVITIFAVILSLIYNKKELALIALVGGFATPFFVSNGSGNYQILFSYMLILNVGMFAVANFKKWNLLNWVGYALTVLIFGAWIVNQFDIGKGHALGGLLFGSLFYIVFFATLIIYNIKHAQKFAAVEISLLLSNSFLYLGSGLYFLKYIHKGDYQGLFVIALAVFNFICAYMFYKKKQVDKNLIFLLIALVLTFVSLAGPVQLDGNYITLFWASELVILYWLGTKSNLSILKNASLIVLVLTFVSLFMDWEANYYSVQINLLPIVFNKAFVTGLVVVVALLLKLRFVKQEADQCLFWGIVPTPIYKKFLESLAVVSIFFLGFHELNYQSYARTGMVEFRQMMQWVYVYTFMGILVSYALLIRNKQEQKWIIGLSFFFLVLYPIANYVTHRFRSIVLEEGHSHLLFLLHYLIPLFALYISFRAIRFIFANYSASDNLFKSAAWVFTFILCFILSAEIVQIWVYLNYNPGFSHRDIAARATKIAWPILWSLFSLMLMWYGMKLRIKQFRIISLSLFSLTIIKLFAYDISNVSQGGKIAAFIVLGIILLLVSFMYQKIKGLFVEDQAMEQTKQESTHE